MQLTKLFLVNILLRIGHRVVGKRVGLGAHQTTRAFLALRHFMSRGWHSLLHSLCTMIGRNSIFPNLGLASLVAFKVQILQIGQALYWIGLSTDRHVAFLEEALDDLRNVVQVICSLNLCVLIVVACVVIEAGSFVLGKLKVTV